MTKKDSAGQPAEGEHTAADKAVVRQELALIKDFLQNVTVQEMRNGAWFGRLLSFSLENYVRKVDAGYFKAKYPGLPADAVVQARIDMAARYAAVEGALSATAYTGAAVATFGTAGAASPVTATAGATTLAADLIFTSQLQLRLAYDISVLYGVALDLDDPHDLWKLIRTAFVIQAGEAAAGGAMKMVPAVVKPLVKKIYKGGMIAAARQIPVVGKYLLQRNVIKMAIPGVGVPLATAINFWTTKVAGDHAKGVFRRDAALSERARKIVSRTTRYEELLWVMWLTIQGDGHVHENERTLLHEVVKRVRDHDQSLPVLQDLESVIDIDVEDVWLKVARDTAGLEPIYDAAVLTAGVDGKVHAKEVAILRELADRCAVEFDERAVEEIAAHWS